MLKDIAIRSIKETDAPRIHRVALEAWRYTYATIFDPQFIENFVDRNYSFEAILSLFPQIQLGTMFFHVAEHEAKIIGFCNIGIHEQSAVLYRIYLLPAFIGQGIGRRFLELGEAFLVEHGIDTYSCFVHKNNEIGKRFYLHCGFKHISEKDHVDEWFMVKKLSAN